MSVVGVSYLVKTPVADDEARPPTESVETFNIQRQAGASVHVLYDCDESEWFAVMDADGGLVTRPQVFMQPTVFPLVTVNYETPMPGGVAYFGGVVDKNNGYVVAMRSAGGVRILEVLPEPGERGMVWRDVEVDAWGDEHAWCTWLLGGERVVSCYRDAHRSNKTHHSIVIATRTLKKHQDSVNSRWTLSASEEVHRVRCAWEVDDAYAAASVRVSAVCVVAPMTVSLVLNVNNSQTRVFSVDVPTTQGVVLPQPQPTDGGRSYVCGLTQSREQVYMRYFSYVRNTVTTHVKSITGGGLHCRLNSGECGFAVLPGYGIIRSEINIRDDGQCNGVLHTVSDAQQQSTIATTDDMPMQGHLGYRSWKPPIQALAFHQHGVVWMDRVVEIRMTSNHEFDRDPAVHEVLSVCFARCFRGDAIGALEMRRREVGRPSTHDIKLRPITGGQDTVRLTLKPPIDLWNI